MATMGEFGSLLQLGFGVGAGLSVFRAPMNVRVSRLRGEIEAELGVLERVKTPVATEKLGKVASLKLEFDDAHRKLLKLQNPFLLLAIIGATCNLVALIYASLNAQQLIGPYAQLLLICISVVYYLVIAGLLELSAQWMLSSIAYRLSLLRGD